MSQSVRTFYFNNGREPLRLRCKMGTSRMGALLEYIRRFSQDDHILDLRGIILFGDVGCSIADLRVFSDSAWKIKNVDLRGADLRGLRSSHDMTGCLLDGVRFDIPIPVVPDIDRQILDTIEQGENALDMMSFHACATTHCRAGWAITLAGEGGRALEERVGATLAGSLIYGASRPGVPVPDFFDSTDEEALEDMRKAAGKESAP